MNADALCAFFMWCTIINAGLLVLSSLTCVFAGGLLYRIHSKWFSMPRETFNAVLYSWIGLYKMAIIMFNLTPYLALLIMK